MTSQQISNTCLKLTMETFRTRCELYSKLIIKTMERRHRRCYNVLIVNSKHISYFSSASIVDFEKLNVCWEIVTWTCSVENCPEKLC